MIDKLFRLLQFMANAPQAPRVRDVAEGLDLPRATAYRLVSQLRDEGVLASNEEGALELGPDFVRLVVAAASRTQLAEMFADLTEAVSDRFQETAFLGRLQGDSVTLIDAVTPRDEDRSYIYPGLGVRPLHACSSSRAILAFLGEAEIARLLPERLDPLTDRTVVDRDGIAAELAATRARGYAICDEEIDEGVTSVAVPLPGGSAGPVFSVGVVGPKKRIAGYGIADIGTLLGEMAGRGATRAHPASA